MTQCLRGPGEPAPSGERPPDGVTVLLVDDEEDAREALRLILQQNGMVVTTAASAREAFELVERLQPDILLSDIAMPGEDGLSLIRRVRLLPPGGGGLIPAAALSAYAGAADRRSALLAGFQHHVAKPVDPARLLAVIATLARRSAGGPALTPNAPPRALIVDDDPGFLAGLARARQARGLRRARAPRALKQARAELPANPPDILLVDLHLPDGSGLALLDGLEPASAPEVVLITGSASVETAVDALRRGVADYLTKPVDFARVKMALGNVTRALEMRGEIGTLRGELRKLGRFGAADRRVARPCRRSTT